MSSASARANWPSSSSARRRATRCGQVAQPPEHDQVLAAGQDLVDGGVLPGQPDAGAHLGRLTGHVEAGDPGVPGIRSQQRRQDPDGGCLARPVRSQQAVHSALRHGQVQVVERRVAPEALAQAIAGDGGGIQDAEPSTLYTVGSFNYPTL